MTRRDFTLRATALIGALAAGPLFGQGSLAFAEAPGPLAAGRRATLLALLEGLPQPPSGTADQALQRFERIYTDWDEPFRQAVNATLDLLEAGLSGANFSDLPLRARRAFIDAQTAVPAVFTDFGSERAFHRFVEAQARATRQVALLDLQAELDQGIPGVVGGLIGGLRVPGGLLDGAGELLEPVANGPLLLLPDPRTGFVPDFDQLPADEQPLPPDRAAPSVSMSSKQQLAFAVGQAIELGRLAFVGEPEAQEDEGIDAGEGEPADGEPESPDAPGDVPLPEEEP